VRIEIGPATDLGLGGNDQVRITPHPHTFVGLKMMYRFLLDTGNSLQPLYRGE